MGIGTCTQNNERCHYSRNYPDIDGDGYVEDWWKRAVDDMDEDE